MACNIIQGDSIDCRDSVGGLGLSLLIGEYSNVPQANITAASGVISAMTCSSGKRLFKYELTKEDAQFTDSVKISVENGTVFSEQTLTFTINGSGFVDGASISINGTLITINSTTFISASEIQINISVNIAALIGTRSVTVTNPDSIEFTLENCLTIQSV